MLLRKALNQIVDVVSKMARSHGESTAKGYFIVRTEKGNDIEIIVVVHVSFWRIHQLN